MTKWFMAVAVANQLLLTDGDAAFVRVNNRAPAHALPPGEVAAASNCRFENGKPRPRFGVARDAWGIPGLGADLVGGGNFDFPENSGYSYFPVENLVVGQRYLFILGDAFKLTTAGQTVGIFFEPGGEEIAPGVFTATQTSYWLWAYDATHSQITSKDATKIYPLSTGNTCAYEDFSDPTTNSLSGILITDAWRDGAGEDGGRGRAWRIVPGNAPQEIELNGHDVWGTARLVQCDSALLLLRHGNERHYFIAADVDATADTIQLHVAPSFFMPGGVGLNRVRFELGSAGSAIYGANAPAPGNYYYAQQQANNKVKLFSDAGATNQMVFDSAQGKFYLELATDPPPPLGGNGAPILYMQPNAVQTAFEVGFNAVPVEAEITDTNNTSGLVTAPSHRLFPADAIRVTGIVGVTAATTYYAAPQSEHTFLIYDTSAHALVDDGVTGIVKPTNNADPGSVRKASAAAQPLPACREGAYMNGRFIGIINRNGGGDLVIVSDPYDFMHCTIWASVVPANQGEAGKANWIRPLGDNAVAVGKDLNVIGIAGLSGANTGWTERVITQEYNGVSPLCAFNVGTDVWFWARKGLASVIRTVAGETLGDKRPITDAIPDDLQDIDWTRVTQICGETWNNRVFIAVPTKGQTDPVNNKLLVLNRNNQGLRVNQSVVGGDIVGGIEETGATIYSWEGSWSGDLLIPYAFAKLNINGEERLTFATPDGLVCWLHDGWDDAGGDIATEILTRGYFGGRPVLALKGKINHDTFNPSITASIVTAGVNEETTLAGFDGLTYDRTKYLVDGAADYDPATSTPAQFDAPRREDYSPTPEELLSARLDVHQNITEPFYCRERGVAPQIRYRNAQGSARLAGVSMQAKPIGVSATREA